MYDRVENEYFEWLYTLVCGERYSPDISYRKLLTHLYSTEFIYILPNDVNRAKDGIDIRYRFTYDNPQLSMGEQQHIENIGPCTVFEMMIALAIRCENVMDDPGVGDRTRQWFWGMVASLGLGSITDDRYDEEHVDMVIKRFLNREYEPNGEGGLFTIKKCECDLRDVEIWHQLWWYLNNFT